MSFKYKIISLSKSKIEKKLIENELRYRSLFQNISNAVAIYKAVDKGNDFIFVDVNSACEKIDKIKKENLIGRRVTAVFPGVEEFGLLYVFRRVWETGHAESFPIKLYKDKRISGWRDNYVYKLSSGEIVAVYSDETERMETQRALIESEKKYRDLYNNSPDMLISADANNGKVIECNTTLLKETARIKNEVIGEYIYNLYHPDCMDDVKETFYEFLSTGEVNDKELILAKKDGDKIHVSLNVSGVYDEYGNLIYSRSTLRDIGNRKKLEAEKEKLLNDLSKRVKELKCFYALYEMVNRPDITVDGIFAGMVSVLPAAWQYPEITCVKITYDEKEYRSDKFMESEWHQSSNIYANRVKCGAIDIYYNKHMPDLFEGPFIREERELIDLVAERLGRIVEHETAIKELEKSRLELRNLYEHMQSVREEERTAISREIHDELGQAMTAVKMDLSWIKNRLQTDQHMLYERIISASEIIDSTIETIRKISYELRPGILDDIGLVAAIEWQADEIQKRTGLKCDVISSIEDEDIPEKQKVTLYRIFQETMTNVIRHSKASRAVISISKKENDIVLKITDNGIGITKKQIRDSKSLGLIGIKERIFSCNGSISIRGIKNTGTTVKAIAPLYDMK